MNTKMLFLDDERYPEDVLWVEYPEQVEFVIVRTFKQFCLEVCENLQDYEYISFDHDLQDFDCSGQEYTGQDCLRFLIEYCIEGDITLPEVFIHTKNIVGSKNLLSLITTYNNHFKEGCSL